VGSRGVALEAMAAAVRRGLSCLPAHRSTLHHLAHRGPCAAATAPRAPGSTSGAASARRGRCRSLTVLSAVCHHGRPRRGMRRRGCRYQRRGGRGPARGGSPARRPSASRACTPASAAPRARCWRRATWAPTGVACHPWARTLSGWDAPGVGTSGGRMGLTVVRRRLNCYRHGDQRCRPVCRVGCPGVGSATSLCQVLVLGNGGVLETLEPS
jgi:hypothetical protein